VANVFHGLCEKTSTHVTGIVIISHLLSAIVYIIRHRVGITFWLGTDCKCRPVQN